MLKRRCFYIVTTSKRYSNAIATSFKRQCGEYILVCMFDAYMQKDYTVFNYR